MPSEKSNARCSENRRCNKPIMEKRRRARINSCLNDLKALILEALKKDPARHSKLEKADILEMTVRHLQNLQRQQSALAAAANPHVTNKFRAGFNECAEEVQRFVGHQQPDSMDNAVRQRLLGHLANCTNRLTAIQSVMQQQQPFMMTGGSATDDSHMETDTASTGSSGVPALFRGLQLVPTRLPNGDLALLLPATYSLPPPQNAVAPPSGTNRNTATQQQQQQYSRVTSPTLAAPHHGDFQQHSAPNSPHYSSSCSSSGSASPSPPPPSYTAPEMATTTTATIKREPQMSAAMLERFRAECRTGGGVVPTRTTLPAAWSHHQDRDERLNSHVMMPAQVATQRQSTCEDDDKVEECEAEPWRPW